MAIFKESAPHLRRKASVTRMMVDVLIALAPTLIFAFVSYPLITLAFYLTSVFIMVGAEFVYVGLRNMMPADGKKHSFKERFAYAYKGKFNQNNVLTAAISAIIFTLIMPAGAPIYAVIIGALAGIVFGKLVFGGLGSNIFNPAAVGMLFAKVCFGSQYKTTLPWFANSTVVAGATPLTSINGGALTNLGEFSLPDMIIGTIPGTLGEVCKITIVIGLIYLLIRQSIDWRIIVSFFGTFILLILVAGLSVNFTVGNFDVIRFLDYSILSGGVLFGGVFMLTDPVTSPINAPSRWMYGIIAAISTVFIRLFAALPEGMGFSILIANMIACVLDHYEWSSSRYTWKKFLAMGLLVVIPALTIFLVIKFGGVLNG